MTTWNPADAGVGITLSNGNLTAASTAIEGVRGTISKTTGKWYYEAISTGAIFNCGIGVAVGTADLTTVTGLLESFVNVANGYVFNNSGGGVNYFSAWVVNDVCCVALDLFNKKIWFRKNNGNWNGSPISSQDPSNGVGGIDLSWITVGTPVFPYCGYNVTGANAMLETANFGASVATYTIPGGFAFWDSVPFQIHPFV